MGFFKNSGAAGQAGFVLGNRGYRYEHLPEKLREDYNLVAAGISNFQKRIPVSNAVSREDMDLLAETVLMEQIQFFYVNPLQINLVKIGGKYAFEFEYIYDKKTAAAILEQIDESAKFILSQIITEGMTDYEKTLAVHDYITENVQYNFSALSLGYVYDAHTIEGALLKKQAVCEGIAKGIAYLLNKLDIQNIIVKGDSEIEGEEVGHAWNIVELGGDYYHIDATWDLQEVNHFTSRSHMYFNLDDDSMVMNHDWKLDNYPSCDSNRENYYVKEKRYFRTMRSFELFVRKFLQESGTYMDVRFEDTLEIPDDGGKYIASVIQKTAEYMGKGFQISYIFNAGTYVFQANVLC